MAEQTNAIIGIGRRKTSTAIVKIFEQGKGKIQINGKAINEYFPVFYHEATAVKPLVVTELKEKFDAEIKVTGGGPTGQIDAIKLGISRALVKYDSSLTSQLREHGLLTRDPRMKERKKYGQKGARGRFQWTKR